MSCIDDHMKAHMLKVHMTTTKNWMFSKDQVPLIMVQMVYTKVALRVWVI
jgi:hypothetical protein